MQIVEVNVENFLALKKADFCLANRGLVLIQGDNQDDPSADSNGAGKSSVVDAICWAIYGSTARGITGDAVVNREAKKNCKVSVFIEDGNNVYTIIRSRKPNRLEVFGGDPAGVSELTKGTEKETQELIVKIMGCSQEVFMAAVYAGQEAMPDLPGMTDKALKLLIEEAAGVELLADAYNMARSEAIDTGRMMADAELILKTTEDQRKVATVRHDAAKRDHDEYELERASNAKHYAEKAKLIQDDIAKALLRRNSYPAAQCAQRVKELNDIMEGFDAEQKELHRLQAVHVAVDRELQRYVADVVRLKKEVAAAEQAVANINKRVGLPCGECGKPYATHDLATATQHAEKALLDKKAVLLDLAKLTRAAHEKAQIAQEAVAAYRSKMSDPSAIAKELATLNNTLAEVTTLDQSIRQGKINLQSWLDGVKNTMAAANPYDKTIEREKQLMDTLDVNIVSLKKSVAEAEAKSALARDAVAVFGPAGVRAHILDTVTPFLNERTAEYLGALSDGAISAVWSTLSKTAKGELREKFCIEVTNSNGADCFAGLSGGEKRKVRLACAMALQDLVATRATKPINLFIADEVDHALDESGLERLMGVLEQKARERGTVLVISHNSLSDWIDTVMTVVKSGGQSVLTGATV